jgi:predicted MPP superfamily phosphohydrolase
MNFQQPVSAPAPVVAPRKGQRPGRLPEPVAEPARLVRRERHPEGAFTVCYYDVPLRHLPEAFHGVSIVQISDIHLDEYNIRRMPALLGAVNALQPDILALTGDYVTLGDAYIDAFTQLLCELPGRIARVACLGNHDYIDGGWSYKIRDAFDEAEFDLLINESLILKRGSERLAIVGLDDLLMGRQSLETAFAGVPDDTPRIVLAHNPMNFPEIARQGADLVLSGHTHGGQIRLPWPTLTRQLMGTPFIAGHYAHGSSRLYVSCGLGSAVIPLRLGRWRGGVLMPRIGRPAEVAVLRLVRPAMRTAPPEAAPGTDDVA